MFILVSLYQVIADPLFLGAVYGFNGLVFAGLFYSIHRLNPGASGGASGEEFVNYRILTLLCAGVFLGFAALLLVHPDLLSMVWGVEGLLLIFLGARYSFSAIRIEGYLLVAVGLFQSASVFASWLLFYFGALDGRGGDWASVYGLPWFNLWSLGFILYMTAAIMTKAISSWAGAYERIFYLCIQELFSLWISVAFFICAWLLWPGGAFTLSLAPLFFLLYRSQCHELALTELFALSHYLLFFVQLIISAPRSPCSHP